MTTKYQAYESGDTHDLITRGIYWQAQTFTPEVSHKITSVKLFGKKIGSPPTSLEIKIYAADGNHKPTGPLLCSGSLAPAGWQTTNTWTEIDLGDGADLTAETYYIILIGAPGSASSSNCYSIRYHNATGAYTRGVRVYSMDGGATWLVDVDDDVLFSEWGVPPPTVPTVTTNDADTIDHESAKLHGTLTDDGGEACDVRFQYGKTVGYGTDTTWQPDRVTNDTFEQLIASLDPDETYHFRAQAQNSAGIGSGMDKEFQTSSLPPVPGAPRKIVISHPALKTVRVLLDGSEQAKYDGLSDPDQHHIESGLELTVATPCHIEVTTLADQVYTFYIPEAG